MRTLALAPLVCWLGVAAPAVALAQATAQPPAKPPAAGAPAKPSAAGAKPEPAQPAEPAASGVLASRVLAWRRLLRLAPYAAHVAAVSWLFQAALLGSGVFYFRDIALYYFPNLVFLERELEHHVPAEMAPEFVKWQRRRADDLNFLIHRTGFGQQSLFQDFPDFTA